MALAKPHPAPKPVALPEQLRLADATAEVQRLTEARREAQATLEEHRRLTMPQTETTGQATVEEIRQIPGTTIGRLMAVAGLAPSRPLNVTPAQLARARAQTAAAEERLMLLEADLDDAKRAAEAARLALGRRQFKDRLPPLTVATHALLADAEALAARAEAVCAEHIQPLLEHNPFATAVQEAVLFELSMLRERAPRLRALLAALTEQYGAPSPNGGADRGITR